ncbi:hypothetical protein [Oryzicola mucosus]|uniref:Uncharacterized protein n=1 Tax=Oryzicola mucosus TaxID=2767425 RepID=A0A8J6U634_9HYPH|nr:hypothetical protein [Oryzicola mucosus]MBD0417490.1 hypothetical protein [Oryzicola mucosus]
MTRPALHSHRAPSAADDNLLPEERLDAAIAAARGDLWAAAMALAMELGETKTELLLTRAAVSHGFSRGWHHRRRG